MDPEVRKALQELQELQQNTQARMYLLEQQKAQKKSALHRSVLTAREIEPLPQEVPLFKSIGKMFILADKEAILDDLEVVCKDADSSMKKLDEAQEQLEQTLKMQSESVRDLVTRKHTSGSS
eukprot:gene1539-4689_t